MDTDFAQALLEGMGKAVPEQLVNFGKALDDADYLTDGWAYFLEKPWKWSTEYALWRDLGAPQKGNTSWDTFWEKLEAIG